MLARLFAPASLLSWTAFWWLWTAGLVAVVIGLGWRRAPLVRASPPVPIEPYHGNVHLPIATLSPPRLSAYRLTGLLAALREPDPPRNPEADG
jgi:hypothetical protein